MEKQNPAQLVNHINILKFWHKIEFFIPYELQQVFDSKNSDWNIGELTEAGLEGATSQALWRNFHPLPGHKLSGFDVYLGTFDKTEMVEVSRTVLDRTLSESESFEQEERGELEGPTCIAHLRLNAQGEPLFDDFSVSTAPWALGRIRCDGLDGLDFDQFEKGLEALKLELKTYRGSLQFRGQAKQHLECQSDSQGVSALTGSDLQVLL